MGLLLVSGPIASGKSQFIERSSALLRRMRRQINAIELDSYGKEALDDPEVQEGLVGAFGADVVKEGVVDTALLSERAFESPTSVAKLNEITHPYIGAIAERDILSFLALSPQGVVLLETPFPVNYLRANGYNNLVDLAFVVALDAPYEKRMERCKGRISHAEERDAVQKSYGDYTGDVYISNDSTEEAFNEKIDAFFAEYGDQI